MLKIGSLQLDTKILLAPLAGVSDSAMRLICREHGARFTFVEMINARAISFHSKKTKKMLKIDPRDRPIGVQLLGCEVPYVLKALDVLETFPFDVLDFNAACPVRKVCRRGEGAALMKDPKKLKTLLVAITKRWRRTPVTIKIRSGWDLDALNAPEIARIAEDAGVAAVFVHGRTREQFYRGAVDSDVIARVKRAVKMPVLASGDILSAPLARTMLERTGVDGLLVARGALGRPWIFREIEEYLELGRLPAPPSLEDILKTLTRHLELSIEEHGEKHAVPIMRKFVGWYLKGQPFVRPIRQRISGLKTPPDFFDALEEARRLANHPPSYGTIKPS
jgi:tRNA-dihydrouridine synthase B